MSETKIRVVTAYDGDCPWRDLLERNLTEYCQRWGYDLRMKFDGWEPMERHLMWRKIQFIRWELIECDWLLWLDADCFVLNMTIPLTHYTSVGYDLGVTGPFVGSCPFREDGNDKSHYSAGVMLMRNCAWIRKLMTDWWYLGDKHDWKPGNCERTCLEDTNYLNCHVMLEDELRKHVHVFPLGEIGWATLAHSPSQFIAHCYGSLNHHRRERFIEWEQHVLR